MVDLISFFQDFKSIITFFIVGLIILSSVVQYLINSKYKNKKLLTIILMISFSFLTIWIIPTLIDYRDNQIAYDLNKPELSIDIHKIDTSFAKLFYNIPEDKITYWIGVQNTENSPNSVDQINLDIYFSGFIIDRDLIFKNRVNDIKQDENVVSSYSIDGKTINYKMHSLVIDSMLPGGAVIELVVINPKIESGLYPRIGEYDYKWTWNLNGKNVIETGSSKLGN